MSANAKSANAKSANANANAKELGWVELFLGNTRLFADEDDKDGYTLEWHMAASTLYVHSKGNPVIELRLEREIHDLQVNLVQLPLKHSANTYHRFKNHQYLSPGPPQ
jgi:hypothetical protein